MRSLKNLKRSKSFKLKKKSQGSRVFQVEAIENLAVENVVAHLHASEVHKPVEFCIFSKRDVGRGQGIYQCLVHPYIELIQASMRGRRNEVSGAL
jgi:hypothetical protein